MKQIIPVAKDLFKTFALIAADGLHKLGATVGLTHITEIEFREKLDNMNKTDGEFQNAKTAFGVSKKALDAAFADALAFTQVTRDVLKPKLGSQYSRAWDEVGFVNDSLKIPRSVPKTLGLLGSMTLFLEAHPELNIEGAATPELATAAFDPLASAYSAFRDIKTERRQKKKARNDAVKAVRRDLINLRRELSMLLEEDDPRWLDFGFNVPADVSVPAAPEGFTAVPGAAGAAALNWTKPVNTDRFHLYQQVVGVDADPVRIDTLTATSKELSGLTSGAHVKFYVTAVNAAGESLPSVVVEIVVP